MPKLNIKLAVVLSDLHIGSTVGLWPNGFINQEGNPTACNGFQKWLARCWDDLHRKALPEYLGTDPYVLILNGDIMEGIHHRTLQVMTVNPTDQTNAAKMVLAPVVKKAHAVFIVKGTEVHTKDREISLGDALKAVRDTSTGQHAFDKLTLEMHGCRGVIRHHMTTSMRPYLEATALSTELGSERIEAARNGHKIPQFLCLAHRHRHGIFRDSNGLVCVTSAWQGLTRHGHKVVGSALPAPSCIVLDWRRKEYGAVPHAEDFVYQPRAAKAIYV